MCIRDSNITCPNDIGKIINAPINDNFKYELIFFILLLIIININKQIIYFNIYGIELPDDITPIIVDMNIGILYLSTLLIPKKNAIPKGAIEPIKIVLLNKKPIKLNIITLESI